MSEKAVVYLKDISFSWKKELAPVLSFSEFEVGQGERVLVKGPSGSGKTTFLGVIGGVLIPQAGTVEILGKNIGELSGIGRDAFRVDHIGFIFQMFNLLPYLTVLENVVLPCRFSKERRERALKQGGSLKKEAVRLLEELGLEDHLLYGRKATDLSVGQQQRVAVARALLGSPEIIIADEPTSALDTDNRQSFIELLLKESAQSNSTVIFVSHDVSLAKFFDREIPISHLNTEKEG